VEDAIYAASGDSVVDAAQRSVPAIRTPRIGGPVPILKPRCRRLLDHHLIGGRRPRLQPTHPARRL